MIPATAVGWPAAGWAPSKAPAMDRNGFDGKARSPSVTDTAIPLAV
jgi:hypothetical protein